jgi:hypothetical protein
MQTFFKHRLFDFVDVEPQTLPNKLGSKPGPRGWDRLFLPERTADKP